MWRPGKLQRALAGVFQHLLPPYVILDAVRPGSGRQRPVGADTTNTHETGNPRSCGMSGLLFCACSRMKRCLQPDAPAASERCTALSAVRTTDFRQDSPALAASPGCGAEAEADGLACHRGIWLQGREWGTRGEGEGGRVSARRVVKVGSVKEDHALGKPHSQASAPPSPTHPGGHTLAWALTGVTRLWLSGNPGHLCAAGPRPRAAGVRGREAEGPR